MPSQLQLATTTRNARLQAIETEIGSNPILKIWGGTQPASCATADAAGTPLAVIPIPGVADWMAAPASGSMLKGAGTWSVAAGFAGTATHFRIYESTGATCKLQGSCGLSASTPDMVIDNASITVGQTVTVTVFTLNDNNG